MNIILKGRHGMKQDVAAGNAVTPLSPSPPPLVRRSRLLAKADAGEGQGGGVSPGFGACCSWEQATSAGDRGTPFPTLPRKGEGSPASCARLTVISRARRGYDGESQLASPFASVPGSRAGDANRLKPS